jgi:hypothetical protein
MGNHTAHSRIYQKVLDKIPKSFKMGEKKMTVRQELMLIAVTSFIVGFLVAMLTRG